MLRNWDDEKQGWNMSGDWGNATLDFSGYLKGAYGINTDDEGGYTDPNGTYVNSSQIGQYKNAFTTGDFNPDRFSLEGSDDSADWWMKGKQFEDYYGSNIAQQGWTEEDLKQMYGTKGYVASGYYDSIYGGGNSYIMPEAESGWMYDKGPGQMVKGYDQNAYSDVQKEFMAKHPGYGQVWSGAFYRSPSGKLGIKSAGAETPGGYINFDPNDPAASGLTYDPEYGWIAPLSTFGRSGHHNPFMQDGFMKGVMMVAGAAAPFVMPGLTGGNWIGSTEVFPTTGISELAGTPFGGLDMIGGAGNFFDTGFNAATMSDLDPVISNQGGINPFTGDSAWLPGEGSFWDTGFGNMNLSDLNFNNPFKSVTNKIKSNFFGPDKPQRRTFGSATSNNPTGGGSNMSILDWLVPGGAGWAGSEHLRTGLNQTSDWLKSVGQGGRDYQDWLQNNDVFAEGSPMGNAAMRASQNAARAYNVGGSPNDNPAVAQKILRDTMNDFYLPALTSQQQYARQWGDRGVDAAGDMMGQAAKADSGKWTALGYGANNAVGTDPVTQILKVLGGGGSGGGIDLSKILSGAGSAVSGAWDWLTGGGDVNVGGDLWDMSGDAMDWGGLDWGWDSDPFAGVDFGFEDWSW